MKLIDFEEFCNINLDERKMEMSVLKQVLNSTRNSEKEAKVLAKSFIVMTYSHWQGYIDEISKKYLEFVNDECGKGICKLPTDFFTSNLKIHCFQDNYFKKLSLEYNDFIKKLFFEMRFNVNDVKKINKGKGMATLQDFEDTLQYIINTCLINNRNKISHGKQREVLGQEELNILSEFILKLLEKYKDFLCFHLENKTYLNE